MECNYLIMPTICNGKHKFNGAEVITNPRYNNGFKFCSVCKLAIKTSDLRCICCGSIFRIKPKRSKLKEIINRGRKRY